MRGSQRMKIRAAMAIISCFVPCLFAVSTVADEIGFLSVGSYASSNDEHQGANDSSVQQVNPVIQWNRTLLVIVRTPGAQPATVHPTRSFAILHAAIYDAVNAIDATHKPYLVRLEHVSAHASQEAAVDAPAHETLITLYPAFQSTLDQQYD